MPHGGASMDARDATANNADLWTVYLRQQWRQFVDPFGLADTAVAETAGRVLAEVAAANVSSVLTAIVGPAVARMFEANAVEVTRTLAEEAVPEVEIPEVFAARAAQRAADLTQREEWASAREAVGAY